MPSSSAAALRAANRRGVLAMAAGTSSFVTNDSLIKYVTESLPSSQTIFLRGACATALLVALALASGLLRQAAGLLDRRVLLRALLDTAATFTYLTSLFHLPLANATAINMATPIFITLFAVIAFRERVGPGRWLAIATGFAGVLLVVQPTPSAFNAYAVLCLGGTLLHACRDLMTRTIAPRIPSLLVTLSTALAVTLAAAAWGLAQDWKPVTGAQLGLLAAAGVFLSGGYYLLIVSMRGGEVNVIAPFRYAGLLFALLIGFVVWGDVPNPLAWLGTALLVGAGLYVLHGERSRADLEPIAD
jgi:drug/metabolite transporter (DMT)-like permease